jgi:hypothetical protein
VLLDRNGWWSAGADAGLERVAPAALGPPALGAFIDAEELLDRTR